MSLECSCEGKFFGNHTVEWNIFFFWNSKWKLSHRLWWIPGSAKKYNSRCVFEKIFNSVRSHPSQHIYVNHHSGYETCPSIDSAGTTFLYKTLFGAPAAGWSALPSCWEMLNSCACPSPPAPAFIEVDTAAALTSPVAYIHTNAARLKIFLFHSVMLVLHELRAHLQGAGVGGRTHQLRKHIIFKQRFSCGSEENRGSDKGLLFGPGQTMLAKFLSLLLASPSEHCKCK